MKKLLPLLVLVLSTVCANAQVKVGIIVKHSNRLWEDRPVGFVNAGNGKISAYQVGAEDMWSYQGKFPATIVGTIIRDTGFYIGEVVDPVDDYVNVRKGPGTKHPIVGKLHTGSRVYFKKTNSNWVMIFLPGKEKYSGFFSDVNVEDPRNCIFVGYVYKDRLTVPEVEQWL